MTGADVELSDLMADESAQTEDEDDGDDNEWIGDLIDRLDDRGYLDLLLMQSLDVDPNALDGDVGGGDDPAGDGGGDGDGGDLDASAVSQFGRLIIDEVGDVQMSQVVKFTESNPEKVNQLITSVMGDSDGD